MVTSVSNSSTAAASTATPTTPTTKPWAWGDPSSFSQLFAPLTASAPSAPATASTTTSTPAAVTTAAPASPSNTPAVFTPTAPVTPSIPSPLFTFEQGATVTGFNTSTPLNPEELATSDTANKIASMLGGKVVEEPTSPDGGYSWSVPTRDITFANSTVSINAGIAAYLFNTYGTQPGSAAWQSLNQTLGRDPLATTPAG